MDKPLGVILDVHRDEIECLIATKEGDILISGGKDQRINIIDIERREVESSFGIVHDSKLNIYLPFAKFQSLRCRNLSCAFKQWRVSCFRIS